MFFFFGIVNKKIKLKYISNLIIHDDCGKYGRYEVFMTFYEFSIFFIPIFKFDKKYYVKSTCCNSTYLLNKEVGKKIEHGEDIQISLSDLSKIHSNYESSCPNCGNEISNNCNYCPNCGCNLKN